METITSVKNKLILETVELKDKKNDFAFFEGEKQVDEVVKAKAEIRSVFVLDKKFQYFADKFAEIQEKFIPVSENVIAKLTSTKTPQGIVAVVKFPQKDIQKPKGNFLVLDGIQDPGNLGTIIRSAVGADFLEIYCLNCVDFKNEKVLRSTMGNIFKVNLFKMTQEQFVLQFPEWKLPLYSADFGGKDIFSFSPAKQFGIVIGNEGNGVSDVVNQISTEILTIPMKNNLESLNAGVSSAIMMYILTNK